jgi:hypothetical protein
MLKYEKIQMKEALIISYNNGKNKGKMGIKKDYPGYEEVKLEALTKLTEQGFVIETQDILYITDDQLQEYLK